MKRASRSIYADIYVKEAHRIRGTPRVARPWRPKVIAWAGPAAFYRNRFVFYCVFYINFGSLVK